MPPRDLQAVAAEEALFTVLKTAPYGTIFEYPALSEILAGNAQENKYRRWVLHVSHRLEAEAQRTLTCMANVGYRVAQPSEHLLLTHRKHAGAKRRMQKAERILLATPLSRLAPEERRRVDAYVTIIQQQNDALRMVKGLVRESTRQVMTILDATLEAGEEHLVQLQQHGAVTPPPG